jgi:hypothetical protein
MTFIAAMDENGFAQFAAIGNVANRARVSVEEAQTAIHCLESPDPESSNNANEGRRIERVPGGWMVLNAAEHREMITRAVAKEQTRERVRKHRAQKDVTLLYGNVTPSDTDTEARSEEEAPCKERTSLLFIDAFTKAWNAYPKKVGKGAAKKAWDKVKPPIDNVLEALSWQCAQPNWVKDGGQYIPHFSTWLNQRRWEDEPFNPPSQNDAAWGMVEEMYERGRK